MKITGRIISVLTAALILCAAALPCAAVTVPVGGWRVSYMSFDSGTLALSSTTAGGFSLTAFDTGEIKLGSSGAGAFRTAMLTSEGAVEADNISLTLKIADTFSFSSTNGLNSWVAFTWSTASNFAVPASFPEISNLGPAALLPATAASLSVILTGSSGTRATSALVLMRDGAGGESFWSIPANCDLTQPVQISVTADSYFGHGYIIRLGDIDLTADGTGYPPLDLSALRGHGRGFITMSCCGGAAGQPQVSFLSVCGSGANSFRGDAAVTDASGNIVTSAPQVTTEPSPVTGGGGSGNPGSGDAGVVIAVVCLAASVIVGIVFFSRRRR